MPFKRGKAYYFQALINFRAVIYNFQSFAVDKLYLFFDIVFRYYGNKTA